ncbi:MAG: hypothetical protein WAN92_01475 [Herbaspirillum sp.]
MTNPAIVKAHWRSVRDGLRESQRCYAVGYAHADRQPVGPVAGAAFPGR